MTVSIMRYDSRKRKGDLHTATLVVSRFPVQGKGIFEMYSLDDEGYRLSEFSMENPVLQERLAELQKEYPENETVMKFIRINRQENPL